MSRADSDLAEAERLVGEAGSVVSALQIAAKELGVAAAAASAGHPASGNERGAELRRLESAQLGWNRALAQGNRFVEHANRVNSGLETATEAHRKVESTSAAPAKGPRTKLRPDKEASRIAALGTAGARRLEDVRQNLHQAVDQVQRAMASGSSDSLPRNSGPVRREGAGSDDQDPILDMLRGGAQVAGGTLRFAGRVIGFAGSLAIPVVLGIAGLAQRAATGGGSRRSASPGSAAPRGSVVAPGPIANDPTPSANWRPGPRVQPDSSDHPGGRQADPIGPTEQERWYYNTRASAPSGRNPYDAGPVYGASYRVADAYREGKRTYSASNSYARLNSQSQARGRPSGLEGGLSEDPANDDLGARVNRMIDGE